jgi:hypothetical protein
MKLRNDLVDNPEENLPFGNFKAFTKMSLLQPALEGPA